jgi:hypothetical protein
VDIGFIVILCVAIGGLIWFFPKLPRIAQIVVAIVVVVACLLVLLNLGGVDVHF